MTRPLALVGNGGHLATTTTTMTTMTSTDVPLPRRVMLASTRPRQTAARTDVVRRMMRAMKTTQLPAAGTGRSVADPLGRERLGIQTFHHLPSATIEMHMPSRREAVDTRKDDSHLFHLELFRYRGPKQPMGMVMEGSLLSQTVVKRRVEVPMVMLETMVHPRGEEALTMT